MLAVVFYHYRFSGFSGGFVGVDIFFVISGYLITRLIFSEMRDGRFSLMKFYERRIRRIFPALFTFLTAVTLLALVVLLPSDLARFGRSLIAATFFSANILFWHEGGYFDAIGTVKPLLHTWSLAVEEQFYLIYPAALLAIRRYSRAQRLWCVGSLVTLSFAASAAGARLSPSSSFYFLPTRTWELMLGALLALGDFPVPRAKLARDFWGVVGIGMIGTAIIAFSDETPFPGVAALLPCLGTILVMYSGSAERSVVSTALAMRIPVLIGLASYSLYLWHWPLYVFATYFRIDGISPHERIALMFLSGLLAWGSYRYIETPFRGKEGILSRNALLGASFLAMGSTAACGIAIVVSRGCLWRYNAPVQTLAAGAFDVEPSLKGCFGRPLEEIRGGVLCRIGYPEAPIRFLLWGDSHAEFLTPSVSDAASQRRIAGVVASETHCAPLLDVDQSDKEECREFNAAVAEFLSRRPDINEVILAARWARTALGTSYSRTEPSQIVWLRDGKSTIESFDENKAVFSRGLERTVRFLFRHNKRIVAIGPVPEVRWTVPETSAKLLLMHSSFDIRPEVTTFKDRQQFVLAVMEALRRRYDMTLLFPSDVLCGSFRCEVQANGKALYVDAQHLSVFGGEQLVPLLERAFPEAATMSGLRGDFEKGPRWASEGSSGVAGPYSQ